VSLELVPLSSADLSRRSQRGAAWSVWGVAEGSGEGWVSSALWSAWAHCTFLCRRTLSDSYDYPDINDQIHHS